MYTAYVIKYPDGSFLYSEEGEQVHCCSNGHIIECANLFLSAWRAWDACSDGGVVVKVDVHINEVK